MAASRSVPSPVSIVATCTPSAFFALSSPAAAASLNDLSPRPPTSNTSPTLSAPAPFAPDAVWSAGFAHPAASSSRTASGASARAGRRNMISSGECETRRPRAPPQLVAAAAAGLVQVGAAHDDAAGARDLAIRAIRRAAAHHADGQRLRDVLGDREQLRHGFERLARVVLVEPGDDHAFPAARELLAHAHQVGAEELAFVDADHLRLVGVAQ